MVIVSIYVNDILSVRIAQLPVKNQIQLMLKENLTMKWQRGINKEKKEDQSYQKQENKRIENLRKKLPSNVFQRGISNIH